MEQERISSQGESVLEGSNVLRFSERTCRAFEKSKTWLFVICRKRCIVEKFARDGALQCHGVQIL